MTQLHGDQGPAGRKKPGVLEATLSRPGTRVSFSAAPM